MADLIVINTHDGGMVNDPRDPRPNVQRNIQHFDNYTNTRKLTPYRSLKADAITESTLDGFKIEKFISGNGTLWGLGRRGASDNNTQIYTKSSAGDPTSVWTTAPGTFTSSSVESFVMFVLYNNYLYGGNSNGVWSYGDITSSEIFTNNVHMGNTPTGQGIVHSADNVMYFPAGNVICYNNAGSFGVGFTLPSNATSASICEMGIYLAIAFNLSNGKCVVGLWDRDITNTELSEKIDWGTGALQLIETVEGVLCGISTTNANNTALTPRVLFKSWQYSYLSGSQGLNTVSIFAEYVCTLTTILAGSSQRFNELFYFLAEITLNGIAFKGLWKIFLGPSGSMAVSFDQLPMNGTVLGAGSLYGFYRWGDYIFISFINPLTGLNTVWRTDDQPNYTAISESDTTINQGMSPEDRVEKKKLLAVGALYEPLPSGASVIVQYRVDGGAWVTIFIETTDGRVRTEPVIYDATGTAFTDGYEYEFRVQSTGGGEITALLYKYATIKTTSNS